MLQFLQKVTHNVPKTDTYMTRPLDVLEHLDLDLAGCGGSRLLLLFGVEGGGGGTASAASTCQSTLSTDWWFGRCDFVRRNKGVR